MFYSQFILAKKGPLGTIWIAAHLERKLRKNQVADTDIGVSVDSILFPDVPIALRLSSHLLLGVVRIYSRKVNYLFHDCSEALLKVKQAFRSAAVDLPPEESTAPYHSITLPETFDLDDFELPDSENFQGNYVDHHVSSREQITLQDTMDGVVYSTSQFGLDERFGDGDASQIGLDLDEELFLDKVATPRHSAVLLDLEDASPRESGQPMTPFTPMDIDANENRWDGDKKDNAPETMPFDTRSEQFDSYSHDQEIVGHASRLTGGQIHGLDLNGKSSPSDHGEHSLPDLSKELSEHAPSTPRLMEQMVFANGHVEDPTSSVMKESLVSGSVGVIMQDASCDLQVESGHHCPENIAAVNLDNHPTTQDIHIKDLNSAGECSFSNDKSSETDAFHMSNEENFQVIHEKQHGDSPSAAIPQDSISFEVGRSVSSPTSVLAEQSKPISPALESVDKIVAVPEMERTEASQDVDAEQTQSEGGAPVRTLSDTAIAPVLLETSDKPSPPIEEVQLKLTSPASESLDKTLAPPDIMEGAETLDLGVISRKLDSSDIQQTHAEGVAPLEIPLNITAESTLVESCDNPVPSFERVSENSKSTNDSDLVTTRLDSEFASDKAFPEQQAFTEVSQSGNLNISWSPIHALPSLPDPLTIDAHKLDIVEAKSRPENTVVRDLFGPEETGTTGHVIRACNSRMNETSVVFLGDGNTIAPAPAFSTPASSTPAFSTPASSTPVFSTPAFSTPAFSTPASSTPAFSTPAFSTHASSTPAFSTPAFSTPAFSTPAFSTPAFSTPSFSAEVGQRQWEFSRREEPLHAASSFDEQGKECHPTSVGYKGLEANKILECFQRERAEVDFFSNLNGCSGNVVSKESQAEKLNVVASYGFPVPAPEMLLSARTAVGEAPSDLLLRFTREKEVLAEPQASGDGLNILSGRKRHFLDSTPIIDDGPSAKQSGVLQPKRTMDSIPDDNDLLSSILVGRGSSVLKLKSTPSSLEGPRAKRPRATRVGLPKRKVLMDDTLVLHGDTIRQQLTSTEDIRRLRKKAPCTRPEIWKIQKHLLEDEVFNEPLFTGMSEDLIGLHNRITEFRVSETSVDHIPEVVQNRVEFPGSTHLTGESSFERMPEPAVVRNDGEAHQPHLIGRPSVNHTLSATQNMTQFSGSTNLIGDISLERMCEPVVLRNDGEALEPQLIGETSVSHRLSAIQNTIHLPGSTHLIGETGSERMSEPALVRNDGETLEPHFIGETSSERISETALVRNDGKTLEPHFIVETSVNHTPSVIQDKIQISGSTPLIGETSLERMHEPVVVRNDGETHEPAATVVQIENQFCEEHRDSSIECDAQQQTESITDVSPLDLPKDGHLGEDSTMDIDRQDNKAADIVDHAGISGAELELLATPVSRDGCNISANLVSETLPLNNINEVSETMLQDKGDLVIQSIDKSVTIVDKTTYEAYASINAGKEINEGSVLTEGVSTVCDESVIQKITVSSIVDTVPVNFMQESQVDLCGSVGRCDSTLSESVSIAKDESVFQKLTESGLVDVVPHNITQESEINVSGSTLPEGVSTMDISSVDMVPQNYRQECQIEGVSTEMEQSAIQRITEKDLLTVVPQNFVQEHQFDVCESSFSPTITPADNLSLENKSDNVEPPSTEVPGASGGPTDVTVVAEDLSIEGFRGNLGFAVENELLGEVKNDGPKSSTEFVSEECIQRDSSCPLDNVNVNAQNDAFDEVKNPSMMEATTDAETTGQDNGSPNGTDEFGNTLDENHTEFLNFDDEDDVEEGEASIPSTKDTNFLDNSGWSSRTRGVARYLQTLFDTESGHERKVLPLDKLLTGKTRKEASRMFFETLVLKTRDYIQVEQDTPFATINIKPTVILMKSNF